MTQTPPDATDPATLPGTVKAIRVLLWIVVGFAGLSIVAGLIVAGSAYQAGSLLAGPIIIGVPALILALKADKRSKGVWIVLLIIAPLMILISLSQMASSPGSVIGLGLYIALLVLTLQRRTREYYRPAAPTQPPPAA